MSEIFVEGWPVCVGGNICHRPK